MHRVLLALLFPLALSAQFTAGLSPQTNLAFDQYVQSAEAGMKWEPKAFTSNEITVSPTLGKSPLSIRDGMIHDWTASVFVPGAKVENALRTFQDYDGYKNMFGPEVVESKLLKHEGHHWKAFLKLRRKKVLTAELNSEYDVEYRPLDNGRWAILSRSTKMSELEGGRELPADRGHGYLWRLNAYWLLEPRDGGVYLECRSISLSRDIPPALSWAVRPIVASLPKESLHSTVEAARTALR
jgi:hypothetical protein